MNCRKLLHRVSIILLVLINSILATTFLPGHEAMAQGEEGGEQAGPPAGGVRVIINDGKQRLTNDPVIKVRVFPVNRPIGLVSKMKIGSAPDLSDAEWQNFKEDTTFTLSAGDGVKSVFAQLQDRAGNISAISEGKIFLDTEAPTELSMTINQDAKYTKDPAQRVRVDLSAEGATKMQLSNNAQFNGANWERYDTQKVWRVRPGDGDKVVYIRFQDAAGNISDAVLDSIILDTTPPKRTKLEINKGNRFTRERKVTLRVQAEDASDVRIVDPFTAEVLPLENLDGEGWMEVDWSLDSLNGIKTIRAYFKDEAGNFTRQPVSANIIFDNVPPESPRIRIDNGQKFTNHPEGKVNLRMAARSNPTKLRMILSNYQTFQDADTTKFASTYDWYVEATYDSLKTVFVKLMDEAGNVSDMAFARIFLDREAPKARSIAINDDIEWFNRPVVNLTLEGDDAYAMSVSNGSVFTSASTWEPFSKTKRGWKLIGREGANVVYAQFRDEASNVSEVVSDTIYIDTRRPEGTITINEGEIITNDPERKVNLYINANADAQEMQIANVGDFTGMDDWQPVQQQVDGWQLPDKDGRLTVYIRFKDKAQNISKVYEASILLDRRPPVNETLVINNGKEWSTDKSGRVTLNLFADGAPKEMIVANAEDFSGAEWRTYRTSLTWDIEPGDGLKTVFVKYRDAAGNESNVARDVIKYDITPPSFKAFTINNDSIFCTDQYGRVVLQVEADEAVAMAISNQNISDNNHPGLKWGKYTTEVRWRLESGDGTKKVFVRFQDSAGNSTGIYTDQIILDREPPQNSRVTINNGDKWLTDPSRTVSVKIQINGSEAMRISELRDFSDTQWQPFDVEKEWTFNGGDGVKRVFAQFKDKAGNISDVVGDSILLDLTPPLNPSVVINNDSVFVTRDDKRVSLRINSTGATEMMVSQDPNFRKAEWEPFRPGRNVILAGEDGEKTVYVRFRDPAGNLSEMATDNILVDRTPPKPKKFTINNGERWTNDPNKMVDLTFEVEGAHEMMVSCLPNFADAVWRTYIDGIPTFELQGEDGPKTVYAVFRDEAGNMSSRIEAKINLKRSF